MSAYIQKTSNESIPSIDVEYKMTDTDTGKIERQIKSNNGTKTNIPSIIAIDGMLYDTETKKVKRCILEKSTLKKMYIIGDKYYTFNKKSKTFSFYKNK